MKMIISTLLILSLTSAFASDKRDKVREARRQFERMSAVEAFNSNKFDKKIGTIGLPGTSSWVRGSSLCIEGNTITTKVPAYRQVCTEWTYKNSDGDRVYTTNAALARRKDARCSMKVDGAKLEAPISYDREITIWGAKKDGEFKMRAGKIREYRTYASAKDDGSPVKLRTEVVRVTTPTTYDVTFYRKTFGSGRRERENLLGKHTFSVGTCSQASSK